MSIKDLRSPLSKARGLGSAKSGMHHWLMQRLSGLVLASLVIWIFYFIIMIADKSSMEIILVLQDPFNIIPLIILVLTSFYHGSLGMQVVIEDYVSNLSIRWSLIIFIKGLSYITIISTISALIYLMVL